MQKFDVDFVSRTIKILNGYDGPYTFSNTINCTLGLIILPFENLNENPIWDTNIQEIDTLRAVEIRIFNPLRRDRDNRNRTEQLPKTLRNFLMKIRHGIAHQNILPINKDGKLCKIEITNKFKNEVDLQVIFTEEQLNKFALFIAETYLDGLID